MEETKKRVKLLLRYHKRSTELISKNESTNSRSDEYDNFVLTNRDYLKTQLSLCEPAVQKVLRYLMVLIKYCTEHYIISLHCRYSNNYLYKVTATGEGKRVNLKPTIGHEKLNVAVNEVCKTHFRECSITTCVNQISSLHIDVIQEWRDRALECQKSRRNVIKEMMIQKTLCRKFIQMVTGAGLSSILIDYPNYVIPEEILV